MQTTEKTVSVKNITPIAENSAQKNPESPAHKNTEKKTQNNKTSEAQVSKHAANKDALQLLHLRFAVFRDYKPLAIGILDEVQQAVSEFSRTRLRRALHAHVNHVRYLKTMATGGTRLHLDGTDAGEITKDAVDYSKECLKSLKEKIRKKQKSTNNKKSEKINKHTHLKEKVTVANKDAARLQKLQMLAKKFGKK